MIGLGVPRRNSTPHSPTPQLVSHIPSANLLSRRDKRYLAKLLREDEDTMFLLADQQNAGHPAVFVNSTFCTFTGYEPNEIVGKNPSFLAGCLECSNNVQQKGLDRIRTAIALESPEFISSYVVNFKKDGIPFINHLSVRPLFGAAKGAVVFLLFVYRETLLPIEQAMRLREAIQAESDLASAGGSSTLFNSLKIGHLLCQFMKGLLSKPDQPDPVRVRLFSSPSRVQSDDVFSDDEQQQSSPQLVHSFPPLRGDDAASSPVGPRVRRKRPSLELVGKFIWDHLQSASSEKVPQRANSFLWKKSFSSSRSSSKSDCPSPMFG
eukprot:c7140_g1_i1.p1 GENE.c7140_g1_i1~~c7140_g1_i1.p1  ORF type:complete len:322 (-),score=49.61 c7140_g1_i1:301-1266(-)